MWVLISSPSAICGGVGCFFTLHVITLPIRRDVSESSFSVGEIFYRSLRMVSKTDSLAIDFDSRLLYACLPYWNSDDSLLSAFATFRRAIYKSSSYLVIISVATVLSRNRTIWAYPWAVKMTRSLTEFKMSLSKLERPTIEFPLYSIYMSNSEKLMSKCFADSVSSHHF